MPEYAFWTLIVSLTIYSLGLTLKAASLSHSLKLVNNEINRFIEQICILKQEQDKTISGLSDLHETETTKIIQEYETEIKKSHESMREILDKYHRLVSPAKLAFLEQWDNRHKKPPN